MDPMKMGFKRLGYDNYETWKLRARQVLTREGLWGMVNDDIPELKNRSVEWKNKNEFALQTIGYLVEDAQLRIIQEAETAKEAWLMLKSYFVKDSSVGKVALIKKLAKMELAEGGDMRQHLLDYEMLFERIENVGCRIDEDMKAAFILASLPDSYENLVSSIQGRMEVFTMNFVKTKLLEEYERRRDRGEVDDQKAMVAKNRRSTEGSDKRLCYACGSPSHLMRNCEILRSVRAESSRSSDSSRKTQSAKAAHGESEGHICFAAIQEESSDGW